MNLQEVITNTARHLPLRNASELDAKKALDKNLEALHTERETYLKTHLRVNQNLEENEYIKNRQRKVMLEITDELYRVCEEYNLDCYAIGGTAIGAVRHKGFIPWDDDMDFYLPRKHFEKLRQIAKTAFNPRYKLHTFCKEDTTSPIAAGCHFMDTQTTCILEGFRDAEYLSGIYVDVMPLDKLPKVFVRFPSLFNAYARLRYKATRMYENSATIDTRKDRGALKNFALRLARAYPAKYGIYLFYQMVLRCFNALPLGTLANNSVHGAGIKEIVDEEVYSGGMKEPESAFGSETAGFASGEALSVPSVCDASQADRSGTQSCKTLSEAKSVEGTRKKWLPFEDTKVRVPYKVDAYLTNVFGDYMQFPPVSEQCIQHPHYFISFDLPCSEYPKVARELPDNYYSKEWE